jgi:IS30 family transposase
MVDSTLKCNSDQLEEEVSCVSIGASSTSEIKGALMTYAQLTREQRYQIRALLKTGHSQMEIAEAIEVHKSTVSRELRRNRGKKGYRPKQAHRMAMARRGRGTKRIAAATWRVVDRLIREDWSPEQVSNRLRLDHNIRISHEWIYQHVLADQWAGGDLHRHLRCQKAHRKRYGRHDRRGRLPERPSIEDRPSIADKRQRIGDWEVDTILGKGRRQPLVTLTERKSRLTRIHKPAQKTAQLVADAVIDMLRACVDRVHTITSDNGKKFAEFQRIGKALQTVVYFAHPYASWERGTNENTNGLIRQYFPKGMDLSKVTQNQVTAVERRLNNRPRKCLGSKTPNEVFFGTHSPVALGT